MDICSSSAHRPGSIPSAQTPRFERALTGLRAAASFDPTLAFARISTSRCYNQWVAPTRYSRDALFDGMADGEPQLFYDFPIDPRSRLPSAVEEYLIPAIQAGFPAEKRARVRSAGAIRYQDLGAVIRRWMLEKSTFAVTDLHYIGAQFDRMVDTRALNDFNILPRGAEGFQSQDSLVISSAGAVTDSHSDDHSGSNHAFVGAKIWLLWDTCEGIRHGLEDATHCTVTDRAAFDADAFFELRSARWLMIEGGQTMFIPAHLSHKVITLERYIGLGSFHLGLPGLPDLLLRWQVLQPSWAQSRGRSNECSVDHLLRLALRVVRRVREASTSEQRRWGLPQLRRRLATGTPENSTAQGYAHVTSESIDALKRTLGTG